MPFLYPHPHPAMPKPDNKRPSANNNRRAHPYPPPLSKPAMSSTPGASEASGHHHTETNTSDKHASTPWSPQSDEQLMHARQQGMNWQPIADKYFPKKTANACRKRHERLMEKRNANGSWDSHKFEELAKAYCEIREPMWRMVAERVNEDWKTVEAKVCCLRALHLSSHLRTNLGGSVWRKASKPSQA